MEIASDNYTFRSHLSTLVIFPFRAVEFTERYGVNFTSYIEDGLGQAVGRIIRLRSGRHYMIKELLEAPDSRLFAEADSIDCVPEGLSELLLELAIEEDECIWSINRPNALQNNNSKNLPKRTIRAIQPPTKRSS